MAPEQGWIFDAYPKGDKMVVWLKRKDGSTVSLEDDWRHSIFVGDDERSKLDGLVRSKDIAGLVRQHDFEQRFERITDREKSTLLRLELAQSTKALTLAENIENMGWDMRLYNVDLLPSQAYYYENDIFTLAYCGIEPSNGRLAYRLEDSQMSTDYALPDFKIAHLDASVKKAERLAKFEDRLASISLSIGREEEKEHIEIESQSEADMLIQMNLLVQKLDPDFVFTAGGDLFLFPYLIHRGEQNNVPLVLGREKTPIARPAIEGKTYFSYGRIHYRPSTIKLRGRIHIDGHNSFILDETGLQGLYEVTRLCRMPLHTASRASIGRCMSSLQFYHAWKKGLLVPWKPELAEHYKTFRQLLIADRGGLIYEPVIGIHEKVAEFDFASLYPSIMLKKNLSGETVECACCPDSDRVVPEVGFRICSRHQGIVPMSLDIILKKRATYKRLKKEAADDDKKREIFDSRQTALKWILVTSFGYLGFNNSKFGRIDAHIAVCAYDRVILKQATRVAENAGFRVLHGIVDSLWVQKDNSHTEEYEQLKAAIEEETGFDISFEGEYKWVVFLPSKASELVPVPNRYFGLFQDGKIKARGIEVRRHDTPEYFAKCQAEVLKKMAEGNTVQDVKSLMPEVDRIFERYVDLLRSGNVPLEELVFTKQLSKASSEYSERRTVEVDAIMQLALEGKAMKAGEVLRYVITDSKAHRGRRSIPIELVDGCTKYDAERYIELLANVCDSVTTPFEHSVTESPAIMGQKRLME
jgi:DNA polymerase I